MPEPARQQPSAPVTASARNRREAAVVDWLITRLAARLGDRFGGRHAPPWEPKQNVLLGVLEPIRVQPPAMSDGQDAVGADGGSSETSATAGTEITVKPAGDIPSLGLDFRIRAQPASSVTFSAEVAFAVYLEEIATLDEQRTYIGTAAEAGVRPVTRPPEATAPVEGQPTDAPDGAASTSSQRASRREAKTRLLGAWRRHDAAPGILTMEVPLDGTVVTAREPLTLRARALIDAHYSGPLAMRPFSGRRNELPRSALASQATFEAAIGAALDKGWQPAYPFLELTAFAQPLGTGDYLVSFALRNITEISGRTAQDMSIYDCQLEVHASAPAAIMPQRFDLAPDDYRLADLAGVIGHGTACVAVPAGPTGIRSETLPAHVQRVVEPRGDHVSSLRWSELAANPSPILGSVQAAMEAYEREFRGFVNAAAGQPHHAEAQKGLSQFSDELRRFRLGLRVMDQDPLLACAFQLANEAFARANAGKDFDTWRLFQLVYIVTLLPALAARERDDAELQRELEHVDVLWFPAGGGKTEAYLGIIMTALFYDRMRGKNGGVTAWLRFPLRMLSVQQLFRTLRVLVVAEEIRQDNSIGEPGADPFALGYLVGGGGTPNQLRWAQGWWKGWDAEARSAASGAFIDDHLPDRLVTQCPYCEEEKVVLTLETATVRIAHLCTACGRQLPLYMSDDEVYRYLPSIVISTVDKLTGYTWFPEYTTFSHGPRYKCGQHGYFSFPTQGTCPVGKDLCPPDRRGHPAAVPVKDPVPALTVQDEMHLLKEELGAFTGHYEGLIAELQRGGPSRLPTKMLAASATIEQYEDQLRQVYGRVPRAFPSAGFERTRSFYTRETDNVQRTFLGILPHYRRKADVAAIVQAELLRAVAELEDAADPLSALAIDPACWTLPPAPGDVLDLLFDYEMSLGYVNSKAHGAKIDEELRLLSDQLDHQGRGAVERVVLTGQVPIPDLANAISRAQGERRTTDRGKRLRAMIGTSVVSHGVDLDRLNVLVLAGMPTTAADYIQVTARAGRTHAGLVVIVYDAFSRRERSLFSNFASYHRFLNQMVMPVPVNKYAYFVADRTLPGLVLALLHDLARSSALGAPATGVRYAKDFQPWWNANKAAIDAILRDRLQRCYATPVPEVNDPEMEQELADRALNHWASTESKALSIPAQEKHTARLFHNSPLANFRDIDEPAEFPVWYPSREAFIAVTGRLGNGSQAQHEGEE